MWNRGGGMIMDRYTIPCTKEQTRKALELGAPIKEADRYDFPVFPIGGKYHKFPTAEQMAGWLKEQGIIIETALMRRRPERYGIWGVTEKGEYLKNLRCDKDYLTRQEAILAAIDAALEWLTDSKKNNK